MTNANLYELRFFQHDVSAREREDILMKALSAFVGGAMDYTALEGSSKEWLRQLGYAASLARGSLRSRNEELGELARICKMLAPADVHESIDVKDPIQKKWGARYHLDARKIRLELPLHDRVRQ